MTVYARHGGLLARDASWRDIINVGLRMRDADREEVLASCGLTPIRACALSALASDWLVAVVREDTDLAVIVFGVTPDWLPGHGVPWLLSAPEMTEARFSRTFLRHCRVFLRRMLDAYTVLSNRVDARNAVAIRWLTWLGFTIRPAAPWGPLGLPFHKFELRRNHVHGHS